MIKINLLPVKRDRRKEAARNQILIAAMAIAAELIICVLLYSRVSAQVTEQKNKNRKVRDKVEALEKEVADHQSILDEIAKFEKRQDAIKQLLDARIGPVYVLLELSNIMSKLGRPHIDQEKYQEMIRIDPALGYDEHWDYRRVWLTKFNEKNRKIQIGGEAMTHEDVAEFLRRVNLSSFFVESELISTTLTPPKLNLPGVNLKDAEPVVHFELKGKVKYR